MTDQFIECTCKNFKTRMSKGNRSLVAGSCVCGIRDPSQKTSSSFGKVKGVKIKKE